MQKMLLSVGVLLFAGAAAHSAKADSFYLVANNGTAPPCSTSSPCAKVTLTVNGSGTDVTFTVSSLDTGYVFDTFGFNGPAGLSLVTASGEVNSPSLGGSGNEDGWGSFAWNFHTGESGGSNGSDCVVTGGTPGAGCTFSFEVSGTGLTLSEFEVPSSGGNGSGDFAGHMAASNNSGYSGDSVPITPPVPEPSSLLLLGTGILGAAGTLYRRTVQGHVTK